MKLAIVNDRLIPQADLDPIFFDRGLYFGDGVYEVLRSYHGKIFALDEHLERFAGSMAAIRITGIDIGTIRERVLRAFNAAGLVNAKIYFHVTRGSAPRNHTWAKDIKPNFFLTISELGDSSKEKANGIAVCTHPDLRWKRCDIKSLNLLGNVLATQEAKEAGAYDAILVRDGVVTEGSHTGVCAVFDGTVVTHPLTPEILGSVTRDFVLRSCRELGAACAERDILVASLYEADEVMLLGTTSGIMPVIEIDGRRIGVGCPGPVTRRLQAALHSRMLGGTLRA